MQDYTFNKLLEDKSSHSKMSKIDYSEHTMQTYFKSKEINTRQAKLIFKYRTHMLYEFQENFRGIYGHTLCSECSEHLDSQDEVNKCRLMKENIPECTELSKLYESEMGENEAKILKKVLKFKSKAN